MQRSARSMLLVIAAFSLGMVVPRVSAASPHTYAEKLMTDSLTRHPNVLFLVVRANAPAGSGTSYTTGRVDAASSAAIAAAERQQKSGAFGERYLAELPLQDVAGAPVGWLTVGFSYDPKADVALFQHTADAVQHELRRKVTNAGNLIEPYPYDPSVPPDTFAQRLVDETLSQYPDILILAIHSAHPNDKVSMIIGSNIGRIGKKDTEDDMQVLRTGKPYLEIKAPGDRYEDILILRDRRGKTVGTVAVLLPFHVGGDASAAQHEAELIRDEMGRKIPSLDSLFVSQYVSH